VHTASAHVDGEGEVKGSDGESTSAGKPAKRATQLPDDFRPGDKHVALAAELDVDLLSEWPQFCDHHRAKGSTMKDWNAALNTWIRNAARFGRTSSPTTQQVRRLPDGTVDESTLPPVEESWMRRRPTR
jgi:hypothetical protein